MRRLVLLCLLLWSRLASAQELSLKVDSSELYANLPFVLHVVAQGFDDSPAPELSKLQIPGCRVTAQGVQQQTAGISITFNGQPAGNRQLIFVYRFLIEAEKAGRYMVPALTALQGSKKASTQPANFNVRSVDDTKEMQLRLTLPDRPLWVGETIEGSLDWYLRPSPGTPVFAVPLFDQEEWVEIESLPGEPRLPRFRAGSKPLDLSYEQTKATLDGTTYNRYRFPFRLTPNKPGMLQPQPARVVAELQVGYSRDMFGFAVPETKLFQAVAKPLRLEIRALPLAGRPPSFKNAVGRAFAIEVQAGRTVVRVGDPVELRILLRGKGRLAGLILPELFAMGLPAQQFSAPEEPPAGEVLEDGKGKLFRVSVRLRSTDAREIPALSFTCFDPETGRYETMRSQPIALSVKGSAVVAAGDVVGAPPVETTPAQPTAKKDAAQAPLLPLVGADLALGDEKSTLRRAPSLRGVLPIVIGLYGAAVALLLLHVVRVRKRADWQHDAAVDKSLRSLRRELVDAQTVAARDAAPRICTALRALRKEAGQPGTAGKALLDRLETEAYSPGAARDPLPKELRDEVETLAQSWSKSSRGQTSRRDAAAVMLGVLFAGSLVGMARADDAAAEQKIKRARAAYQAALSESDRDRRRSGFAEAESTLRELATTYFDRPQLLADWGSAALLAQEPGRAVLAYRRALQLDPTLSRARRNLSFLRERLPDWLPRPRASGAIESLLFLNQQLPQPRRHLALAASVLLAVALLIPWSQRRRRTLRLLSSLQLAAVALLGLSLVAEHDASRDAVVVVAGGTLRAADSLGAPPTLSRPLPAGAEVIVDEVRNDFTRVSLADGQTGWLPTGTLELLTPANR